MIRKPKFKVCLIFMLFAALLFCGCGAGTEYTQASAAKEEGSAPVSDEEGIVHVSDINGLLAAIAPDTKICLDEGNYVLSRAADYGRGGGEYYSWETAYDGYELHIRNVSGLSISAPGEERATVTAVPRYANVICFDECSDLTLSGLIAGHTELPGICEGGVLYFSRCRNVSVNDCSLYGCGILGLQAFNCKGLSTVGTEIYDCSYGAVYLEGCRDVLFDGCAVHDCTGWFGLFDLSSCDAVGIINTRVHDNSTPLLLRSRYTDLYFAGNTVTQNGFTEGMIAATGIRPVIDGCEFSYNSFAQSWYLPYDRWSEAENILPAQDAQGNALSEGELAAMKLQENIVWTPAENPSHVFATETVPNVTAEGAVHVSTVDELIAAIAPNTKIFLEAGEYDLSKAYGYGSAATEYCTWEDRFDGFAFVIHNVTNLVIMSDGAENTVISTAPRYADVLCFESCGGVTLSGLTVGHTEAPGECAGGVLYFSSCDAATVENCSLYGCGIIGISASGCEGLRIAGTEIHHCSCGGISLNYCFDVRMDECSFHDNGGENLMVYGCNGVVMDGEELPDS